MLYTVTEKEKHMSIIQTVIDLFRRKKKITITENFEYYAKKNNKINIIGDSHSIFFSGKNIGIPDCSFHDINFYNNSDFKIFHIGPVLAYSLNKTNTKSKGLEKVQYLLKNGYITKNSVILCCFGEIDIRVHVLRQAERQNKMPEEIIDGIIENYLDFLLKLKQSNIVCVWGPVATQSDRMNNPEYPIYGSMENRNKATKYFNEKLKKVCSENQIGFLSIFNELIDENFRTKYEYYCDEVHLSQNAKWLCKDLLDKELKKYVQ